MQTLSKSWETSSSEETQKIAESFGKTLSANTVVALFGELGSGKTTFIKGLIAGIANISPREVNSPTFTYLNIYTDSIYHFDLYRLKGEEDFLSMGFDEYFKAGGICCIEWPERISSLIPPEAIRITLEHIGQDQRRITIS